MKNIVKRYLALVLSFALVLAIPVAFTQEANAASGGKKVNQPVQITKTTNDPDESSWTRTIVYDKKGLAREIISNSGSKTVYTYSKKGLVKTWQSLDKNGAPVSEGVNTIKKNKIRQAAYYDIENGQKVLTGTTTYKYKNGYKKDKLAKETYVSADGKEMGVTVYRKNGKLAKYTWTDTAENYVTISVYDKHGNITSATWTDSDGTYTTTYANTYKKGKLIKSVATDTDEKGVVTPGGTTTYTYTKKGLRKSEVYTYSYSETDPETGAVSTSGRTVTKNYKYTKAGLIKNISETSVYQHSDGTTVTYTDNTSYAYKKIKVKSKVLKAVKKALKEDYQEPYQR